jgi:hypothetical protein
MLVWKVTTVYYFSDLNLINLYNITSPHSPPQLQPPSYLLSKCERGYFIVPFCSAAPIRRTVELKTHFDGSSQAQGINFTSYTHSVGSVSCSWFAG